LKFEKKNKMISINFIFHRIFFSDDDHDDDNENDSK
jgi:hypothetical protein